MDKLRIAFLTSEYISEEKQGGGLANYLNRITHALKDLRHEPEVFVTSNLKPKILYVDGVRVNRVKSSNLLTGTLALLVSKLIDAPFGGPVHYLLSAMALSRALEKRHKEHPFNIVQSTNCSASGLFVRDLPNRTHLLRLSSKRDLWLSLDHRTSLGTRIVSNLERKCFDKISIRYAPSDFIAKECSRDWGKQVTVLRPPVMIDKRQSESLPFKLPNRYLLHYGQICHRKGSDLVAQALVKAWEAEPDFEMVWVGRINKASDYENFKQIWGQHSDKVHYLGSLPKDQLYYVLDNSIATVLPSRVDNLPNTVIESLMLDTPVIGSLGASIDELINDGKNGTLVEIGNVGELAKAMLAYWKGDSEVKKPISMHDTKCFGELSPSNAAQNLINLAELDSLSPDLR